MGENTGKWGKLEENILILPIQEWSQGERLATARPTHIIVIMVNLPYFISLS